MGNQTIVYALRVADMLAHTVSSPFTNDKPQPLLDWVEQTLKQARQEDASTLRNKQREIFDYLLSVKPGMYGITTFSKHYGLTNDIEMVWASLPQKYHRRFVHMRDSDSDDVWNEHALFPEDVATPLEIIDVPYLAFFRYEEVRELEPIFRQGLKEQLSDT